MNFLQLSKEISYALRHAPWEYELELDENGWVNVDQLLIALKKHSMWENITQKDLEYIIKKFDKKRFEIIDGNIRALYGHSIPMNIFKKSSEPPTILFHGTSRHFLKSIKNEGLLPQKRQYVHLSSDIKTAFQVGKRHDNKPIILKINAKKAWNNGIKFYMANNKVWLADNIPSEYIEVFLK